ncbi:MAG TPA: sulfatase-like hydrolase/transferase [Acidobacteriaceae bacterium]
MIAVLDGTDTERSETAAAPENVVRDGLPPGRQAEARPGWLQCWLEGAGAAILLMPGLLWNELSPTHIDGYHRLLPLTTVARALAIDLVLLSLAALGMIRMLERVRGRAAQSGSARRGWTASLLWAVWISLLVARGVEGLQEAQIMVWEFISAAWVFPAMLLLLALLRLRERTYRGTIRGIRAGLSFLGVCLLWMVPTLIVAGVRRQPYDVQSFRKPIAAPQAGHRRIVWVLFDGMSYDQVFDHRWPGLAMPNFDQMRSQSVTFSSVRPDGRFTEDVVPSLLLGVPIRETLATSDGWLLYRNHRQSPWRRFDSNTTLFADAHRAGWTTGLTGWYNPYCRLLRDQLDSCWMDLLPLPDHFSRDKSTLENVFGLLPSPDLAGAAAAQPQSGGSVLGRIAEIPAVDQMIGDESLDLCFVHLPFPHPPGRYDRRTGTLGEGGSYIDNLALSDRALRRILADVGRTEAASRTTVIVSSDHSWRVWLWRDTFGWSREDEEASEHGQFDPRPMLMVRFPGETAAAEVSHPVPLLAMHDLVERLMAGEIGSTAQLQAWAARQ